MEKNGKILKMLSFSLSLFLLPAVCACGEEEIHEHVYSDVWSYDETYHWQEPICKDTDEPRGKSLHNYVKGVCSLCGYDPNPKSPDSEKPSTPSTPDLPENPDNPSEDPDDPWMEPEDPGDTSGSMKLGATDRDGFDYTELIDESGRLAGYAIAAGDHLSESSISIPASYKGLPVIYVSRLGFRNCTASTITIPDGIVRLGELAFDSCTQLSSFTMPNSVEVMEDMCFYNCTSLSSIKLSDSLTGIYYRAFFNCGKIESMTIPDSVLEIGGMAFQGCSAMRVITLGKGICSVGMSAFKDCKGLSVFRVPDIMSYCNIQFTYARESVPTDHAKHMIDMSKAKDDSLDEKNYVKDLEIDGVEKIPDLAFCNNLDLRSVKIGSCVKEIGIECFKNCISVESITIANGVEEIDALAFGGCIKLIELVFPDSVKTLGYRALGDCLSLASVTIGPNVKRFEREIFLNCNALKDIYYKGSASDWEKIDKDYQWNNMMSRDVKYHYNSK